MAGVELFLVIVGGEKKDTFGNLTEDLQHRKELQWMSFHFILHTNKKKKTLPQELLGLQLSKYATVVNS